MTMRVFISWSGPRSKQLAKLLHDWFPIVLQNVQVYMSSEDIETDARWFTSVASELQSPNFGLLCLTPENLTSPWIHFEAGAISKVIEHSRVVPVLFDLKPGDIKGPLDQFYAVTFDKGGVFRLLKSMNNVAGGEGLDPSRLEQAFSALWPRLDTGIKAVQPDIKVVDVAIPPQDKGLNLTYPLKCYVQLRNDSASCIDVHLAGYIPNTVTLKQFVSGVLQVKLGEWYPRPDGVDHVAVLPGQLFRAWVGLDESKFTEDEVRGRSGQIGTLVLTVNGAALNIVI
jgi:TIR domain